MSDPSSDAGVEITPTIAARIDAVCDRYEADWRSGQRPRLDDWLDAEPESWRPELLRQLLSVELGYRHRAGEQFSAEEYRLRFPGLRESIYAAFRSSGLTATPVADSATSESPYPDSLLIMRGENDDSTVALQVGDATSNGQRFRVLRPHARGGLGAVSVALDEELHREVALKEILAPLADDLFSRRRFIQEAEITGGLEHPGIAPVYGLGTYADGRPYYAMRFIRGDSLREAIARFHDAVPSLPPATPEAPSDKSSLPWKKEARRAGDGPSRDLELRRFLRRFLDVCNAISYAHSRGVLHRDIKPSNIILGKHGETLVVDWGLAKATGQADPTADELALALSPSSGSGAETLPGSAIGTPAYMSPEQAAGDFDRLGPQSDVYSLGATLYCLLTGKPPFEGSDIGAVLRQVQDADFPPPRRHNPAIAKPLEAICLKAMAKQPSERYATAKALADDIERWLADEPVVARPEPLPERARRWVRRHRTLATTGVAAALVGLAALGVAYSREAGLNERLALESSKAQLNARNAISAVKRFSDVVRENRVLKDDPRLGELRKTLLKEPLAFYRSLRDQLEADSDPRPDSLERLASASITLASLIDEIGDKENALWVYQEALAAWDRLARIDSRAGGIQSRLADTHDSISRLQHDLGRLSNALRSAALARDIKTRLANENPKDPKLQRDLADSHDRISLMLAETGATRYALESQERAREIWERLTREHPGVAEFQRDLARSEDNTRLVQTRMGLRTPQLNSEPGESLAAYKQRLKIQERLVRENPNEIDYQFGLAQVHNNIGNLQHQTGKPKPALVSHLKALVTRERLARDAPSNISIQRALAQSYFNLGNLHVTLAQHARYGHDFADVLSTLELPGESPTREDRALIAACYQAFFHSFVGHLQEGLLSHERARHIRTSLVRENPRVGEFRRELALSHESVGLVQLILGQSDDAAVAFILGRETLEQLATEMPSKSSLWTSAEQNTVYKFVFIDENSFYNQRYQLRLGLSKCIDPNQFNLEARLTEIAAGRAPENNQDRVSLAWHAYTEGRYALAARFLAETLESGPADAPDFAGMPLSIRYWAARAAALAGCGKGDSHAKLSMIPMAELRNQARTWLEAELAKWSADLQSTDAEVRGRAVDALRWWQIDPHFEGVRDVEAFKTRSERERQDWLTFWSKVEALLAETK